MNLKEFITSAISDISEAVKDADAAIKDSGGLVNPGGHDTKAGPTGSRPLPASSENFVAPRTKLNFDIAVSAAKAASGEAGAKAKIWVVEASIGGEGEIRNETVSRLTFSLDVVLPHDNEQSSRLGKVKSN